MATWRAAAWALVLVLSVGWAGGVSAQDRSTSSHPEANRAIDALRSPFCPGLMLEVCPSPQAEALRDSIQMLAEGGMTSSELVEWMVGNHGEIYRAVPKAEGAGLLAWLGPPLALVLGIVGLIIAFRRLLGRRVEPSGLPPRPELSEADRTRVREALQELETLEEPIL
jgi:cytochrome c-type biogenesis protein CcmH/NrfF